MKQNLSIGETIVEGKARIPASRPVNVFYNPKMRLNRDLAVLFASSYFPPWKKLRVCDPMTGTGVRAIRYALECKNVGEILAADSLPDAADVARESVRSNYLERKVTVLESEANALFLNSTALRFDIVDLDPFGSPAPFFECALRATADGGVVAATATDMGPLSGARRAACRRKYGVEPVRTEFEKEFAVRALAASMGQAACRLGLGIMIPFAHTADHYARIYAAVSKGNAAANLTVKTLAYLEYCRSCLNRELKQSIDRVHSKCEICGESTSVGGPLWAGALWDKETVTRIINEVPALESIRITELQQTLSFIQEELDAPPLYFRTDILASKLGIKPPNIQHLIASLHQHGIMATRTHFHPNGIRTNASVAQLDSILAR